MPQPIDPNTEILRATAAERIQQIADRASLAAQSRGAAEAADEQVRAESQVKQMNQKSEEVESELRRKNPYQGRRRKRKKDGDHPSITLYNAAEQEEFTDDPDAHDLDIII